MRSNFSTKRKRTTRTAQPNVDETYDLRGLNITSPDQVIPKGEAKKVQNARMYQDETSSEQTSVAIRTRNGSAFFSTPVGQTANVSNVAANTGDTAFSTTLWIAQPFVANASGALTKVEPRIKKDALATGHVIVNIYTDNSGRPGNLLAQSSILASSVTTSYQYLASNLMDAPSLVNGTTYWMVISVQDGTGTYYLEKTAAAGGYSSVDGLVTMVPTGSTVRYRTYTSTSGTIKGFTRRNPKDTTVKRTLFAMNTNIYSVDDSTGTPTSIDSTVSASATNVRFDQVNDKTMWTTGFGAPRQWDGTTVSDIPNAPTNSSHLIIHQQRAFFVPKNDPTSMKFSELNNFESYPAVNLIYVPSPTSPDHITALVVFQDNLVVFTHETKHQILGSNIADFQRKEAVGTKGAVSQEAVAADRNSIYFIADDLNLYSYNGISDKLLSSRISQELKSVEDPSKIRLHVYNNQVRIYYPKSPSSTVNCMALYDITYDQFFLDTGRNVMGSLEWTLNNNELIEFSSKVGQIFKGENTFSDMGKAIDFKYWTPYKAYSSGASKDRIKAFRPILRTSSSKYSIRIGKDIDFLDNPDMRDYDITASGATWGDGSQYGDGTRYGNTSIVDRKAGMSGRGKHTQYRFEKNGVETPVFLYGYISLYKTGAPR